MKRAIQFIIGGLLSILCLTVLTNAQDLIQPIRVHAQANDIRTEGQLTQEIRVIFESDFGSPVDISTLGADDILVTGPNAYEQRGRFISAEDISPVIDPHPNGEFGGVLPGMVIATYHVLPSLVHDGPWSPEQNGAYAIQLRSGVVSGVGFQMPPSLIGSFRVALGNNNTGVPVLPIETSIRIFDDEVNIDPILPRHLGYKALVELHFSQPNVEVRLISFKRENNTFIANFEALSYAREGEVFPAVIHVHSEEFTLGELEPGNYRFIVRSQNQRLALKEFAVDGNSGDISPPSAVATSEPIRQAGTEPHRIRVIYEDPSGVDLATLGDGDLIVQDANRCILPNEPNAAGDVICLDHARLAVEFVEAAPTNTTGTRVEAIYRVLPPPHGWSAAANGTYQIQVASQEVCDLPGNCTAQRVIGSLFVAIQPEPNAVLSVNASNPAEVSATVVVTLPPQHAVVETSITRENGTITLNATSLPTPGVPEENAIPVVETLSYAIGELSPGQYLAVFRLNGERRAADSFTIEGDPGPIRPNIAFITVVEADAAHVVSVGVILAQPNHQVLDWGQVRHDGRQFFVEIVVGPSDATIDPVDPADNNLPEGWDPNIGGFPIRLVTHEYPLGVLAIGEYVFVVTSSGDSVARKAFLVGGTGPDATLQAEDIESPKEAAHRFNIGFRDSSGLDHESIQTADVTVRGPDGFEATAELVSYVTTLDPLGIGAASVYAVRAPGGTWDAEDSGAYRISIDASAVLDRDGNALAKGALGGFEVRILPEPPQPPGHVTVSARLQEGIWIADVRIDDDQIRITEWGDDLIRHGRSILALASAVEVDPNDHTPGVPPNGEHSYRLGELAPGYYVFVFKTDLGHCGITRIRVPGIGDGGFNAWRDWIDADGMQPGFGDYAFAMNPKNPGAPEVHPEIFEGQDGRRHGGLRFRRLHGASDVEYIVQCSSNMVDWQDASDLTEIVRREIDIDGTEMVHICLLNAIGENDCPFLRVVARRIE
jgi:hypothetical protein